ncbi:hypothetical protein ABC304_07605 [Microbacterium sp. 1P10UB]|uniref:hypothetical protein n=1 Tax=unclassified Microbacterium TaxID=2609290 RepID=UPI0039A1F3D4
MTDDDDLAARIAAAKKLINEARAVLREDDRAQKAARKRWARTHYQNNRDEILDRQRTQRAEQKAQDPDGFRERARTRNQRWRDNHKDEINEKQREQYWANRERERERRTTFYAANAERLRQKRREHHLAHQDADNAAGRTWRERETRRRRAGLPTRRIHRTTADERRTHAAAANDFFSRDRTAQEIDAAKASAATPADLWAAWQKDCLRARATHHLAEQTLELARLNLALTTRPAPTRGDVSEQENARLDAIAKVINDQLRHPGPTRRRPADDPTAPHRLPSSPTSNGLTR